MRVLKITLWSETGNHKDDSDLFPLQYNHSMKSLGQLITTKGIGQSTADPGLNAGWPYATSKKHMSETQQIGLDSILGPFVKGKQ